MHEEDARAVRQYKMNELGNDRALEYDYTLIPYITAKPAPESFNLPDNIAELAAYLDERDAIHRGRKRNTLTVMSMFVIVWVIVSIFAGYADKYFGGFMNGMALCGFGILFVVWPITAGIHAIITPNSFREAKKKYELDGPISSYDDPRKDYQEYKKQLSMYEYWKKRQSPAIWALVNDRELNESLTQIYRRHGYRVRTEHLFYSQHRELSLEKDGNKTVVYGVRSGKDLDSNIVNVLASNKLYHHAIIVAISSVPEDIKKLAQQKHVELLGWRELTDLA